MRKRYEFGIFHKQKIQVNIEENLKKSKNYIHTGRLLMHKTTDNEKKQISEGGSPMRDASTLASPKEYNLMSIERRSIKPIKNS